MSSRISEIDSAFVLHSVAYKETSLIVELFCRNSGRIPVIAKGAKRPHSSLRSVLVSFQPLEVRFTGKAEVKTLTHAEWAGGLMPPEGKSLFAAYYVNELLMRGLEREDAHAELFDLYQQTLTSLCQETDMNLVVRHFEIGFLRALGYGLDYCQDAKGQAIQSNLRYDWTDQTGWRALPIESENGVLGLYILKMGAGEMDRSIAAALRQITRQLLLTHIAPHGFMSRAWMEHLLRA